MTGDGNRMFLSLSYHIFGYQEEHLATRKLITEFECLNQQQFAKYLLEVNEPDIQLRLCGGGDTLSKRLQRRTSKFHFISVKSHPKQSVMSGVVSVQFALLKS